METRFYMKTGDELQGKILEATSGGCFIEVNRHAVFVEYTDILKVEIVGPGVFYASA